MTKMPVSLIITHLGYSQTECIGSASIKHAYYIILSRSIALSSNQSLQRVKPVISKSARQIRLWTRDRGIKRTHCHQECGHSHGFSVSVRSGYERASRYETIQQVSEASHWCSEAVSYIEGRRSETLTAIQGS
jgi:hypothetical protein